MHAQLDLLRAVMRWDPPVWIFGGIAEDALLHGRYTRAHDDIDVLVLRDELELRLEQARALGFGEFQLRMESAPGVPLVGGAIKDGLNLEFVVFDRQADGRITFDVPAARGTKRVWLPEGSLDGPETMVEGVRVRTVSPLALYQIRAGVVETFGGMRPKDEVSQAKLRARFFAGRAEEELEATTLMLGAPLAPACAPSPTRTSSSRRTTSSSRSTSGRSSRR